MSQSARSSARFFILAFLVVGLAACDSVTPEETVILTAELSTDDQSQPIRFTFNEADIGTGRLEDISCNCDLDVSGFLTARGFAQTDIVSATVQSARLVMLFPINERLDFLNQAILKLQATGNSVTEVANQSTFTQSREISLTTQTNRDVAGFMDSSTFQPILQIDADRLQTGADYEIGLVMNVRIEVSGL